MTVLRSLALGISERVTRWASPGCREWAQGQARELAYIENDWCALAWALGSTRVLLERRIDAERGQKKRWPTFSDCMSWLSQNVWTFWMGMVAFSHAAEASHARSWQVRLGSTVIALGWTYVVIDSLRKSIGERKAPPISDVIARAAYSRERLQWELAKSYTFRRWLPALMCAAMCGAYLLVQPKWLNGWAIFFGAMTLWVLRQGSPAKKIQARIANIDTSIAEYEDRRIRALTASPEHVEFIKTETFPNLFRRRRQFRRRVVR